MPILTYLEYRKYSALNGLKPLNRKKTGPFIDTSTLPVADAASKSDLKEVFQLLQEDGLLSRKRIVELVGKVGGDEGGLLMIFDVLGKDEITEEELFKYLS